LGANPEPFLLKASGLGFYNTSSLDMRRLMDDQDHIGANLSAYIQAFSDAVRDIFERFNFYTQIDRLTKCGLLYQVAERFGVEVDLGDSGRHSRDSRRPPDQTPPASCQQPWQHPGRCAGQ
jgi:hypothetical protein